MTYLVSVLRPEVLAILAEVGAHLRLVQVRGAGESPSCHEPRFWVHVKL